MTVTLTPVRTRWFRNALLCLALATAAGIGLTLTGEVDPVHDLLSYSIRAPHGALLLALAACGLAGAGGWLCVGASLGLERARLAVALMGSWSVSMVAVAFFPTNLPDEPMTPAAVVHRWGAAVATTLPPLFALLVAELASRRGETRPIRMLRWTGFSALAACTAFAAVNGQAVLFDTHLSPLAGLAERILLILAIIATTQTAWILRTAQTSRLWENG
jgi:hypothetical protein